MTLTLVFSVGVDPELLSARNFVLQSAGYFVGAVYLLKEAADYFKGGDFDMVLRYQSTPTNEKDRLNSWIRDSGSRIPVVSVSDKLKEKDRFAGITAWSDPNELLMGISHALSKAAIPSTLT